MAILVVGASGATGRLLVEQLLFRGEHVKAIVRSTGSLPEHILVNELLTVLEASITELSDSDLAAYADGCDAIASCLGHSLTFKGMFGQPRRLVTETVRRLCKIVEEDESTKMVKVVLMNTTGNRNRDLVEPISFAQKCIIFLLRYLLPPHADNENAADYLRTEMAAHNKIEWSVVRPDTLVNVDEATDYKIYPSPIRSAIFDAGKTSRINVAHFIAELICENATWNQWRGQMPVIYNAETKEKQG